MVCRVDMAIQVLLDSVEQHHSNTSKHKTVVTPLTCPSPSLAGTSQKALRPIITASLPGSTILSENTQISRDSDFPNRKQYIILFTSVQLYTININIHG